MSRKQPPLKLPKNARPPMDVLLEESPKFPTVSVRDLAKASMLKELNRRRAREKHLRKENKEFGCW